MAPEWRVFVRSEYTPPPPPPAPGGERFPGDPNPLVNQRSWWGAAVGGNADPTVKHETPTGTVLAIRRRYWSQRSNLAVPNGSLATAVREDHAAGRLPWVSFKTTWEEAATGGYDAEWDALIAELESYSKPTWIIFDHEPENDTNALARAASWRGAQARFRDRLNAHGNIQRIAFGASLMYYTWNPISGRNPEDWWPGDGVWDYHGNDHYTEVDQEIDRSNPWENFVTYCEGKGIPFTLPEWGLRGEDPNGPDKMQRFYDKMLDGTHDCVAFGYFDSSLNSTGTGWELDNENGLLDKFHSIMLDPRSINLADMGY